MNCRKQKLNFFIIFTLCALIWCLTIPTVKASGDSILHLGSSGYADLPDSNVSDLDYSRNFSIEAEVNIDAYQEVGRHAKILGKTTQVYDASSGFALSFTNFVDSFGQSINSKIGDGTAAVIVQSPKNYVGQTHLVLTWNVSTKTMNLFVNGELAGTKSNTAINQTNIKSTSDLTIGGGGYYGPLGKDIIFARLWNRDLSAGDVLNIYNNFSSKGQHTIPSSVSSADLKSEWLMEETSDASGNSGTTHIKDTAESNHLLLQGGALIEKGSGSLTPSYPANGETGVSPAITLKASGGAGTLGTPATDPLWYYFQIDESSGFNSANLKNSGWQSGSAEWKPILKPATTYYWRVKVKNSADTPTISSFTDTYSFQTRNAQDWYVRPGVYTGNLIRAYIPEPTTNTYGVQDGSSYANAWNGIRSLIWGENGISAGDNLYVCGQHTYVTKDGNFIGSQGVEFVKESGYSETYPITIRMDCPSDEGKLWGTFRDDRVNVSWSGPDANGVYSTTNLAYGAVAQLQNDGSLVWLKTKNSPTWSGDLGAVYNIPNPSSPWLTQTSYVKTTDGSSPDGKIYSPSYGFKFNLGRSKYINFYRANFYNSPVSSERYDVSETTEPPAQHIVFDTCTIYYGGDIGLNQGNDYWTIHNSDIGFAGNGIYVYGTGGAGANYLTVDYTKIHDIGVPGFESSDCHGIGVQGGEGNLFEYNEIWNGGGSAIEFWTYNYPMKNMTVRYNYIHNIYAWCSTGGGGIAVSGDNVASVEGLRTGYKIYNNVIANVGLEMTEGWQGGGIGSNNKDPMEVYNNVIINADHGISANVVGSGSVQGEWYNNMVINPRSQGSNAYEQFISPTIPTNLYIDNNLFYPAKDMSAGFTVYPFVAHDTHSVFADPQFVSAIPSQLSDFALKASSAAINAGKDVGIMHDIIGTSVPQGSAPDIGAYEYSGDAPPPTPSCGDGTCNGQETCASCPSDCGVCPPTTYNITDFTNLLADWLQTKISPADVNTDGKVNSQDLGIMMSQWE